MNYEQCIGFIEQFGEAFPDARGDAALLSVGVVEEGKDLILRLTLTEMGKDKFMGKHALPKHMDGRLDGKAVKLRLAYEVAPILPPSIKPGSRRGA